MCVFVCFLSPPRSFGRSSPNLVSVCGWTSHLPLRGSFSKVKGLTGQRVTFAFHYIIYAPASLHTLQRHLLLCCGQATESNSAPFPAVHLNAVCRGTSQLLLRGSFSKRSTGSWVNESTGQRIKRVTSQPCMYVPGPRSCLEGFFFEKVNRSTGQTAQQVDGSAGQTGLRINRSLSLSQYYI